MSYKIAVDDGHGLETSGKRTPDGYRENEFNHGTKIFLMAELKRNGFDVVDCSPTRSDNSLQNRCDIANFNDANLIISIHYNALGYDWNENVGGIETYHHPISSNGKKLANKIHTELLKGTKLKDRGVKTANFYILRKTNMPAVLVECGFMDNPYEASLMKKDSYRLECAIEICKGICAYYNKPYIKQVEYNYDKYPALKWLHDKGFITGDKYMSSEEDKHKYFDTNQIAIILKRIYEDLTK